MATENSVKINIKQYINRFMHQKVEKIFEYKDKTCTAYQIDQ